MSVLLILAEMRELYPDPSQAEDRAVDVVPVAALPLPPHCDRPRDDDRDGARRADAGADSLDPDSSSTNLD